MSFFVTRLWMPVPSSCVMSTACSEAIFRTSGEERRRIRSSIDSTLPPCCGAAGGGAGAGGGRRGFPLRLLGGGGSLRGPRRVGDGRGRRGGRGSCLFRLDRRCSRLCLSLRLRRRRTNGGAGGRRWFPGSGGPWGVRAL